jgi:hypothetical protein
MASDLWLGDSGADDSVPEDPLDGNGSMRTGRVGRTARPGDQGVIAQFSSREGGRALVDSREKRRGVLGGNSEQGRLVVRGRALDAVGEAPVTGIHRVEGVR